MTKEKFAIANLQYARYSFGQEIDEVKTVGTTRIKEVSGGDLLSSDVKNQQTRARFRGWTKLIFKGNSIPRFADTTWGFRRRFIEVILPYKFVPKVDHNEPNQRLEDPHILEKITTPSELSGLLNLIIQELPRIIKDGRIYRKDGSFEVMKEQVDSVLTFLERFCLYERSSSAKVISIKKLHSNFETWAELIKGNLVEVRPFGRHVKKFCENRPSLETTIEGVTATVYPGLFFDQRHFDLEIQGLQRLITGSTTFKPDQKRNNTVLEKSQEIVNTGSAGSNTGFDNCEISNMEKEKSTFSSGCSGFQDAETNFDPQTELFCPGPTDPVKPKTVKTRTDKTMVAGMIDSDLVFVKGEAKKKEDHFNEVADSYSKKFKCLICGSMSDRELIIHYRDGYMCNKCHEEHRTLDTPAAKKKKIKRKTSVRLTKIRTLKFVPRFIGINQIEYALNDGDLAEIPTVDAEMLVEQGLVEYVDAVPKCAKCGVPATQELIISHHGRLLCAKCSSTEAET